MGENKSNTEWIDVDTIAKEILPISKSKIREIIKKECDVIDVGNKLLVEKAQLLAVLRKEI